MTPADRLSLIRSLLRNGFTHAEIGARLGITVQHIGLILRQARNREIRLPLPVTHRPDWTRPDAALLKLVHAARREIERAEGFQRPQP